MRSSESDNFLFIGGKIMSFSWINWINMAAVVWLVLINIIVARKGLSDSFNSKHLIVNILEQIGRYSCMVLMILPIFTRGWKFGFGSVAEMLIWICLTILLLAIYSFLWAKKSKWRSVCSLWVDICSGCFVFDERYYTSAPCFSRYLIGF